MSSKMVDGQFDCRVGSKSPIELPVVKNGTQLVMLINAISYFHSQGMDKELGCDNCVNELGKLQRRAVVEAERLGLIEMDGDSPSDDNEKGGLIGNW